MRPPRLLLLDEPTVGVDPVSRRELWQIVYHLVESEGMSVLLSTAYLDEAERCAEVVLLHQGRILGHDQPQAFSRQVAGRTWTLRAPEAAKRDLQRSLSRHPAVLDALILGTSLRVITREAMAAPETLAPMACTRPSPRPNRASRTTSSPPSSPRTIRPPARTGIELQQRRRPAGGGDVIAADNWCGVSAASRPWTG